MDGKFLSLNAVLETRYGKTIQAVRPRWYAASNTILFDGNGNEIGRLKRHDCVRVVETLVDGDGNDLGTRQDDQIYVLAGKVSGWTDAKAIRIADEFDAMAEIILDSTARQNEKDDRLWRKLASAVRTDNPVKLKLFADKLRRRKETRLSKGRMELLKKAENRVTKLKLEYFAQRVEQMGTIDEVAHVRAMVKDKDDEEMWLERIDSHGLFLVDLYSVLGNLEDTSFAQGRGFAVDPNHLHSILRRVEEFYLNQEFSFFQPNAVHLQDNLRIRLSAAEKCKINRHPQNDDDVHSIHIHASPDIDGYYFRIIETQGHDQLGNKYDHWYKFNDHFMFKNARDPNLYILFHQGIWILGPMENTDHAPPQNVLATSSHLYGPWHSSQTQITAHVLTIDNFCTIRCNEGDIYYSRATATRFNPKDQDQLADIHAAEYAYIEAINAFRSPGVTQAIMLKAFLHRSRARSLYDRRTALIDLEAAQSINAEHAPIYLLRGTIQAELGDFSAAYNDLRLAKQFGASPQDYITLQRTLKHQKVADLSAQAIRGKLLISSAS
eukprot:CAMPEP_0197304880 /NCGR_PEP_ID=MMETSP0891-20130614/518_1 /TAXON_ID=44058 ORGANISM="Aureoumbra lagunensis, Strain CCMP1510" /NCGR_SAMPLE_ID=MMETSP0891 /ASSEMBLY_ACC=CAM_ASM_000534 /LENGTH=550 /DNA_ID=CAMNT_0042785239 /DNA_START=17 /DNA_END=1669 /DNA_ORIENTATION=-